MEKTLREQAIEWWKALDVIDKKRYFLEYDKFTPAESFSELTGREIQNIWAVQTNPPAPPTSREGVENELPKQSVEEHFLNECKWQKGEDRQMILELVAYCKEMATRYYQSEWIAADATRLVEKETKFLNQ